MKLRNLVRGLAGHFHLLGGLGLQPQPEDLDPQLGSAFLHYRDDLKKLRFQAHDGASDSVATEGYADEAAGDAAADAIDETLNASNVASVADAAVDAGILVGLTIDVPDGATGDVDVAYTGRKFEITAAELLKQGGNSGSNANSIQVKNGANAITDDLSINGLTDTTRKAFS